MLIIVIYDIIKLIMSENAPPIAEQPSFVIATAFTGWLDAEVRNSGEGGNAILNDYPGFVEALSLDYFDNSNVPAGKSRSHYDRLKLWTEETFPGHSSDDEVIARQLFGVLMGLSGAFRTQCLLISSSQNSYMNYRNGPNPLGLDVKGQVQQRLQQRFGKQPDLNDLKKPVVTETELIEDTHITNGLRRQTEQELFSQKRMFTMRKVLNASRLLHVRREWLNLGVDYMLFAAQTRNGDLAQVPFLEPKTITAAKLVKPLGDQPPYFVADRDKPNS